MRCTKAMEYISLDLDGQLPPDHAAGLTRHLDECADCRTYREDLQTAGRLLAASEPQLSENFEWRLQLRLNQTLAEAAARELHPWQDRRTDRAAWWRNFAAAASVGMAAVLAVAVMTGPRAPSTAAVGDGPVAAHVATPVVPAGDRLELEAVRGFGYGAGQRSVSSGMGGQRPSQRPGLLGPGWSYQSIEDLRNISRIQAENRQLRTQVFQLQRQLQGMQSQLDTTAVPSLDLPEGQ